MIEGKIQDKPFQKEGSLKLSIRRHLASGTYGEHEWSISLGAGKLFVEFKDKSMVEFDIADLLSAAYEELESCKTSVSHSSREEGCSE